MRMKKVTIIAGALTTFVLAVLSYQYLAIGLFHVGLRRFQELVSLVPDQCSDVVGYAAAGFAGVYDYVALGISLAFVALAIYLICKLVFRAKSV